MEKEENLHFSASEVENYVSTQINFNTQTKFSHTELDKSYTLIHVPGKVQQNNPFYFYFQLDGKDDLKIKLFSGITLSYSSYMLTHSQRTNKELKKDDNFYNISSYLSNRLYNNIVCSFNRNPKK